MFGSAIMSLLMVLLGAVLVLAGTAKLSQPTEFRGTVMSLGLGPRSARAVAALLPPTEVAAGGMLIVAPSLVVAVAVALLACIFAAAGATALATRRTISCSCFGSGGARRLGWQQVMLLPAWLLATVVVSTASVDVPTSVRLAELLAVLSGIAIVQLTRLSEVALPLRDLRIALAPPVTTKKSMP